MKRNRIVGVVFLLAMGVSGCHAADNRLGIGDAAPQWSSIEGTDGKSHGLADYKDAKAIVMVFTCNHCPVAVAYEDRLVALQKDYQDKGVQVVAVNSSGSMGAETMEAMKKRAEEKSFNFPYLRDASQKVGRDYGATCTPHVFVLDKDRKLAYVGAIDNNNNADKADKQFLRSALDAVLAGKTPAETVTRQRGCGIRYE